MQVQQAAVCSVCADKKRRKGLCFKTGETALGLSITGTKRQPVRKARNRPLFSSLALQSKLKELKCNVSRQRWSESDHICCLLGKLSGHRCRPVHHWSYCTEAAVSVRALVSVSRVHLGSISWLHYAFNENITANLCIRVSQLHALVLNV